VVSGSESEASEVEEVELIAVVEPVVAVVVSGSVVPEVVGSSVVLPLSLSLSPVVAVVGAVPVVELADEVSPCEAEVMLVRPSVAEALVSSPVQAGKVSASATRGRWPRARGNRIDRRITAQE